MGRKTYWRSLGVANTIENDEETILKQIGMSLFFVKKTFFWTKLWISKFQGEKCFFDLYTKLRGVVTLKITLNAFGGFNYIWKCWGAFLKQIETILFLCQKFFFWNQILIPRNFELKIHFHSKLRLTHTSYSHKKLSVCQKRNLKLRIYSSWWVEQLRMLQCEIWISSHGAIVINVKIFKTPPRL